MPKLSFFSYGCSAPLEAFAEMLGQKCSNVERYEALLVNQNIFLRKQHRLGKKYRPSHPKQFANVFDQAITCTA